MRLTNVAWPQQVDELWNRRRYRKSVVFVVCPKCYECALLDRASAHAQRCSGCGRILDTPHVIKMTAQAEAAAQRARVIIDNEEAPKRGWAARLGPAEALLIASALLLLRQFGKRFADDVYDGAKCRLKEFLRARIGAQRRLGTTALRSRQAEDLLSSEHKLDRFVHETLKYLRTIRDIARRKPD